MSGDRLPVTLLGGYLGAGKTTILNRLLTTTSRRIVVLVNDVGSVNVDAALIADHDGATLTLTNGCVCCAIADDMGPALEQVRSMIDGPAPPEHLVIELSGVGEPARVAPWASTTGFRLDGIVVVADADQIVELADRRFVGDTIRAQLATADLVLLSKTDLVVDGGRAARSFVTGVSLAPVHDAAAVDPDVLFGTGGRMPAHTLAGGHHQVDTVDVAGLTRAELEALVGALPVDVVRAKGVVRCVDAEAPIEIHLVGRRRGLRSRPDLADRVAGDELVVVSVSSR